MARGVPGFETQRHQSRSRLDKALQRRRQMVKSAYADLGSARAILNKIKGGIA